MRKESGLVSGLVVLSQSEAVILCDSLMDDFKGPPWSPGHQHDQLTCR